jgi:hypothetical protein
MAAVLAGLVAAGSNPKPSFGLAESLGTLLILGPLVAGLAVVRYRYAKRYGEGLGEALDRLKSDPSQPRDFACGCSYRPENGWRTCADHVVVDGKRTLRTSA